MDFATVARHIGRQVRDKRLHRGLTQAELARIAGLTRQNIIAIEKGSLTSAMNAYAKVLGALNCDVKVIPAAMPTLDEVGELFD